jgi:hypothetical protein
MLPLSFLSAVFTEPLDYDDIGCWRICHAITMVYAYGRLLVGIIGTEFILAWRMASWVIYCVVSGVLIGRCVETYA